MARPLRLEHRGALWHVTSRGNNREMIFHDDDDRESFLGILAGVVALFNWRIHAWVLMGNHYHILLSTPEPTLSRGMQRLNQRYAQDSNRKYDRCGHLFQGRFKAHLVDEATWMLEAARYVVLNPVRAGMVERPEDYRWSSYRASAGLERAPWWLSDSIVRHFHRDLPEARNAYREFVQRKVGSDESIWSHLKGQIYLGSAEFIAKVQTLIDAEPRSTEHPSPQRNVDRPKLVETAETAAAMMDADLDEIRTTRGHPGRAVIAHLARIESLSRLREIAALLGLRSYGHVSTLVRRVETDRNRIPGLAHLIDSCITTLRAHAPPLPPPEVLIRQPF
ncbi:MAG: transposase [Acidobacteria bacterium]|nr:transposase [Acidobacteriota bacterium]